MRSQVSQSEEFVVEESRDFDYGAADVEDHSIADCGLGVER